MIEYFEGIKTLALNALFNPLLLGLLIILFLAGKFFGNLTRKLNIWKILIVGYFSIFLFPAVRDAGPYIGGIFLLGIASNHVGTFFAALPWAGNLGDVIFAFRYRSAFEDIRRREQDLEDRERKLRDEERRRAYTDQERGQQTRTGWQKDAKGFRGTKNEGKTGQATGNTKSNDNRSQKCYQTSDTRRKGRENTRPAENKTARCLKILGLDPSRSYSPDELKAAYRKKVKKTHPDAGGSQTEFIEVVNAYEWLV